MGENKKGILTVCLCIISLILMFINSILGLVFAVITLIVSGIFLKSKSMLVIISFIAGIVILIISIIMFILSDNENQNAKLSDDKIKYYKECEVKVQNDAVLYVNTNNLADTLTDRKIFSKSTVSSSCNECKGYIVTENKNYKAYLTCDEYETEGFNKTDYYQVN